WTDDLQHGELAPAFGPVDESGADEHLRVRAPLSGRAPESAIGALDPRPSRHLSRRQRNAVDAAGDSGIRQSLSQPRARAWQKGGLGTLGRRVDPATGQFELERSRIRLRMVDR